MGATAGRAYGGAGHPWIKIRRRTVKAVMWPGREPAEAAGSLTSRWVCLCAATRGHAGAAVLYMTAFINETIFQQGSLKPLRKPSDMAIKKLHLPILRQHQS